MKLRLIIDGKKCQGHGRCYSLNAPELLSADENGFVIPRDQEVAVPADQEAAALDAVAGCPEGAIRLTES